MGRSEAERQDSSRENKSRGVGDRSLTEGESYVGVVARFARFGFSYRHHPGVPVRSTPGFMLPPPTRALDLNPI